MDEIFKNLQCPLFVSVSQSNENTNRWIKKEMGYSMILTGGQWSKDEQLSHINVLQLKAVKLKFLTFNKEKYLKAFNFQIDNNTSLLYPMKMEGTDTLQQIRCN